MFLGGLVLINRLFLMCCLTSSHLVLAEDLVPYSIPAIKSVGSGYVELLAPGKTSINGEVIPYGDTKYIRVDNIGTLSSINGVKNGCVIAYSSEGYTESISVLKQSCNEILSIIEVAKKT